MDNYQSGTFGNSAQRDESVYACSGFYSSSSHLPRSPCDGPSNHGDCDFKWRRALPTSDVVLYKKLANTIFSLSLLMNFCAQAGTSLLMYR
jgi:hypothetical protein